MSVGLVTDLHVFDTRPAMLFLAPAHMAWPSTTEACLAEPVALHPVGMFIHEVLVLLAGCEYLWEPAGGIPMLTI